MQVTIIASFDNPQIAAHAASALDPLRALDPTMQITQSLAAQPTPFASLGRAVGRQSNWGDYLLEVQCSARRESDTVGELAALGARKISVSTGPQA